LNLGHIIEKGAETLAFSLLDEAAKVRRIYDIANVLSSMNLIEKVKLLEIVIEKF
jgi:hypothetical protein